MKLEGKDWAREHLAKDLGKPDASEAEIWEALTKEVKELEKVSGEEKADSLDEEWAVLQRTKKPPNEIITKGLDKTMSPAEPETKEKSKVERWYEEVNATVDFWEEKSAQLDTMERSSLVAAEAADIQKEVESREVKYIKFYNDVLAGESFSDRFSAILQRIARVKKRLARIAAGK